MIICHGLSGAKGQQINVWEEQRVYKAPAFPLQWNYGHNGAYQQVPSTRWNHCRHASREARTFSQALAQTVISFLKTPTLGHYESHLGIKLLGHQDSGPSLELFLLLVRFLSTVASPSPRRDLETLLYRERDFLLLFCPQRALLCTPGEETGSTRNWDSWSDLTFHGALILWLS